MTRFLTVLLTALALPFSASAIEIQQVETPGGLTAWLVEEHSIPFAAIELRFEGGGSLDREGKRGAVNLMTALIEEGAGDMDARAFAAAAEGLAAEFSFEANEDSIGVSARFLTENRDEAVALLRKALVEASFPEDALERVRAQVLSGLASDEKDPDTIASRTFDRLAFGDHPYGSSLDGTPESVAALTRQDMLDARADTIARDRVVIGATGDITAEELGHLLDGLLGDLPETGAPQVDRAEYLLHGGVTVVPFDTPQSVAVFGHEGMKRDDPDFFAAYVLNTVLGGGGFDNRLMSEVREKRGLTYGIGSYLVPMDHAELMLGQVASSNDKMAEAISVVREQWRDLSENGVTDAELAAAKTYLTGAYPLRFDGNGRIAGILAGMQLTDLTPEYILTRNDKVNAVSSADIRRVAKQLLRAGDLHFVVVGQPEGLESTN
ncbi:MAG: M16 family metallopeptidase [Brevirhabdus sp.]